MVPDTEFEMSRGQHVRSSGESMVYEIWHKLKNGSWEMVESGTGSGKSRLKMYQNRHPKMEFRLDTTKRK